MLKTYSKLATNFIYTIVYTFFLEKKFYFYFFKKARYNWYKVKKIVVPTLICSNLYLDPLVQKGTKKISEQYQHLFAQICTKAQKASNTNDLRGART